MSQDRVKLDTMGETQQMLVMLSIMREMMKPSEKPMPKPIPRPSWIEEVDECLFEQMSNRFPDCTFSENVIGPQTAEQYEAVQQSIIDLEDRFHAKLNNLSWYVELPDQPVTLRAVSSGATLVWEIRSLDSVDDSGEVITRGMRLGWLPESGLTCIKDMIWEFRDGFINSLYFETFKKWNANPNSNKYKLSRFEKPWLMNECTGIIANNWLYVTSAIEIHGEF